MKHEHKYKNETCTDCPQEPTRECEVKCACHKGMLGTEAYGNECGLCGCSHSIKPPVEEKCKCDCFYSGRASMVEEVRSLISMYKSYFSPIGDEFNKGKHQAMNDLDEKLQALKNKETKE